MVTLRNSIGLKNNQSLFLSVSLKCMTHYNFKTSFNGWLTIINTDGLIISVDTHRCHLCHK